MIGLGIAFAVFIGYLALRRRDEDHAELIWGMIVSAAIAWEAHIGGFLVGLFLFPIFDPVRRSSR